MCMHYIRAADVRLDGICEQTRKIFFGEIDYFGTYTVYQVFVRVLGDSFKRRYNLGISEQVHV